MLERVDIGNQMYGCDSVSMTLTWTTNTGADHYTVAVLPQLQSRDPVFNVSTTTLSLTLNYNTVCTSLTSLHQIVLEAATHLTHHLSLVCMMVLVASHV